MTIPTPPAVLATLLLRSMRPAPGRKARDVPVIPAPMPAIKVGLPAPAPAAAAAVPGVVH